MLGFFFHIFYLLSLTLLNCHVQPLT
jgi:hypothetical protein